MARNMTNAAAVMLLGFALAGGASAQDSVLADLYGKGVHAYYANRYDEAYEALTEAIEQGTDDPRVYYFRGLVNHGTGRPDEARADFTKAARLEATATDRVYDVSRALQRIQGPMRIDIEEYRADARLAARKLERQRAKARYESLQRAEGDVLRGAPAAPPQPAVPVEIPPTEEPALPGDDPFATETAPETPPMSETPAPVTPAPADDDPFGAPPAAVPAPAPAVEGAPPAGTPEPSPADDDPFGAPAADPAVVPATDDPFGAPAADPAIPATDDPFGAPAADPAVPATDDPFGAPAAPAGADPLGAGAAAPPAAAPGASRGALGGLFRALTRSIPGADAVGGAAGGGDPFAAPAGDEVMPGGDPFGPGADDVIPEGGDPFGAPAADDVVPPADDADPFGEPGAPAPAGDDPFGAQGAAPAGNDPFGAAPTTDEPAPAEEDPVGNP